MDGVMYQNPNTYIYTIKERPRLQASKQTTLKKVDK